MTTTPSSYIPMKLSSAGIARAVAMAGTYNGRVSKQSAIEAMGQKTRRAFAILGEISDLRKAAAEKAKAAARKTATPNQPQHSKAIDTIRALGSRFTTWTHTAAAAVIPIDPEQALLAEFSDLLTATPCWIDTDARRGWGDDDKKCTYSLLHQSAQMSETPLESAFFWNLNHPHDSEKTTRLNLFKERHQQATSTWKNIERRTCEQGTVPKLSAHDLILCANIGALDEVMQLPGWERYTKDLQNMLSDLPPWMSECINSHCCFLFDTKPGFYITHAHTHGLIPETQTITASQGRN